MRWIAVAALVAACGGHSAASANEIKAPLRARCEAAGLQGCAALSEGVAAYVAGERSAAGKSLQLAADVNDSAKLRSFIASEKVQAANSADATALEVSSALTSLENFTKADADAPSSSEAPSSTNERSGKVLASGAGSQPCKLKNRKIPCAQRRAAIGPITITDIESPGGCPNELLVFVGEAYDPEWVLSATTRFATHGASHKVGESQTVWIAQRGREGEALSVSDTCTVAWRGVRE